MAEAYDILALSAVMVGSVVLVVGIAALSILLAAIHKRRMAAAAQRRAESEPPKAAVAGFPSRSVVI